MLDYYTALLMLSAPDLSPLAAVACALLLYACLSVWPWLLLLLQTRLLMSICILMRIVASRDYWKSTFCETHTRSRVYALFFCPYTASKADRQYNK